MKKCIAVVSMSLALSASISLYAGGDNGKKEVAAMKAKAEAEAKVRLGMIKKGKALTASKGCAGCHGADGNSGLAANPKLAGQNAAYIVKQLMNFKTGARKDGWKGKQTEKSSKYGVNSGVMNGMAAGLSKNDMLNIAAYYSSQKLKPGKSDLALKTLGKQIYIGGNKSTGVPACIGCHGPAGEGNNAAVYPAVGGQHAAYTEAQLKHFRTAGLIWLAHNKKDAPKARPGRKNDKDDRMQEVVLRLTNVEIKAVASYLQGLRPN